MGNKLVAVDELSGSSAENSQSVTELLRRAVASRFVTRREAELIVAQAERRRGAGSERAKRYVDNAVQRLLGARVRGRPKRAPRMTVYRATPKPPSFLVEVQKQLVEWALGQCEERDSLDEMTVRRAVVEFMADVRTAAASLRRKLRPLSSKGDRWQSSMAAVNAALRDLGLDHVMQARQIDAGEVRQAHRRLARLFHPDLNDGPEMRERFERVQAAYERILQAVERGA